MSLGSGNSKSATSSSTSTTDTTISTVDNRVAHDSAAVGGNVTTGSGDINGNLTISTTDQGAVKGGVDLALESVKRISDSAANTVAGVESLTKDTISQAYGLANAARQSETSGAINNFLKYGVWVALAGILAYALTRKKA